MRAALAIAVSVVLFVSTLALLLLEPVGGFWLSAALPVVIVVLAVARIDWLPWLATPMLSAETLWAFSAPGAYVAAAAAAVVSWCLVGVALVARLALRTRKPLRERTAQGWGASVVSGLLVLAASSTWIPLDLRFALSEDAMNETALAVIRGERDPATIDRIGLWNVGLARRGPGGMRFTVEGAGFLSYSGFAHQADGLPPPENVDSFRYWLRGWYIWTGAGS